MLLATLAAAASPLAPQFHFTPAAGWLIGISSAPQRWSWTSTVRLKDCAGCVPHKTLPTLPPDGIIVYAHVSQNRPRRPEPAWPPTIRLTNVSGGIEGVPSRYGVYQVLAKTSTGGEAYVFVYFGRAHPTRGQIAEANSRLASAGLR